MKLKIGKGAYLESVDWTQVDQVLLDMDGTLLDLAFDNNFWGQRIHEKYASIHKISIEQTVEKFEPLVQSVAGTLSWYSTDFWSQQYGYSIIGLSREYSEGIRWLPFAKEFLHALREGHKVDHCYQCTPDIVHKHEITGIKDLVDRSISSLNWGTPRSRPILAKTSTDLKFSPGSTLFFDDSPVLLATLEYGIKGSIAIYQNSTPTSQPNVFCRD